MLHILTNVWFGQPVQKLIDRWSGALANDVSLLSYQAALIRRELAAGTYLFTDFERIPPGDIADVHALWDRLHASGAARLVNDPRRIRQRYELLRLLHAEGINRFNVYRPGDDLAGIRFPVFVRCEHDHGGARTGLLRDRSELDAALARLSRRRAWRSQLLVTEVAAEPGPDGLYRKYGAILIDGQVLPWHVIASRSWMVKGSGRVSSDQIVEEERRYNLENPHGDALTKIIAISNIEYGRVDYSVVDGRLQIYEINTNPAIVGGPRRRRPTGQPKPDAVRRRLIDAFRRLAASVPAPPNTMIPLAPRRGAIDGTIYRAIRSVQGLVQMYVHRSGVR